MPLSDEAFSLAPRRRLVGLAFGAMHSARRGSGSDVAGSRPYQPGDDVDTIDWNASARLSSARGTDEFVVRERYAEEAPRVVVVVDRRPAMGNFDTSFPWLSKPEAIRQAGQLISASAIAARGFLGYLDYATGGEAWRPPRSQQELQQLREDRPFEAPDDNLERAFDYLTQHRRTLPPGSLVFVLSDFIVSPRDEAWLHALEFRWDVVPVVIQDPVWEQSFPEVSGVVVPFADPRSSRVRHARVRREEVRRLKQRNEERLAGLLDGFRALALEPVLVGSSDRDTIFWSFVEWSEQRLAWRGRGW